MWPRTGREMSTEEINADGKQEESWHVRNGNRRGAVFRHVVGKDEDPIGGHAGRTKEKSVREHN